MRRAFLLLVVPVLAWPQSRSQNDVLQRGEQVFSQSCATGYCHGSKGGPGGAPRLAGRGFNQAYINGVVALGIPGTGMRSFASVLSPTDLTAVVAYVATLNGVANPDIDSDGAPTLSSKPALTGEAALGARLFTEAARGFGRCSTCHEEGGLGISVAAPIAQVPASVAALKALATPNVKTGVMEESSMPVLVLSDGKQSTLFYDLTSAPPVERNAQPGSVKLTDGSNWRHSSVIGAYNDSELAAILAYLRAVITQ
jgi:mono/diheme cytochrome c family protein